MVLSAYRTILVLSLVEPLFASNPDFNSTPHGNIPNPLRDKPRPTPLDLRGYQQLPLPIKNERDAQSACDDDFDYYTLFSVNQDYDDDQEALEDEEFINKLLEETSFRGPSTPK